MPEEQPEQIPEEIPEEEKPRQAGGATDAFAPELTERSKEAIRGGMEKLVDRPKPQEPKTPSPQPPSQTPTGASGQAPPPAGPLPTPSQAQSPGVKPKPETPEQPPPSTPKMPEGEKGPSALGKIGRGLGTAGTAANIARHPKEAAGEAGKALAGAATKKAAKEVGKRALQALTSETVIGPAIIEALDKLSQVLKKIPGVSAFSNWCWKNKWLVLGVLILLWLMPGLLFAAALGGMGGGGLGGGGGTAIIPTITDQALIDEVLKNPKISFPNATSRQETQTGQLQNSILQAILSAANAGYEIKINSAASGKHVTGSFHYKGLAVDLAPTPGLQEFLYNNANAEALNIHDLLGPLPYSVDQGQKHPFRVDEKGHKDHIHLDTYP